MPCFFDVYNIGDGRLCIALRVYTGASITRTQDNTGAVITRLRLPYTPLTGGKITHNRHIIAIFLP